MFEALTARIEQRAVEMAKVQTDETARRLAAYVSPDISVMTVDGGIQLSGQGLARRLVLDPTLRDAIRESR